MSAPTDHSDVETLSTLLADPNVPKIELSHEPLPHQLSSVYIVSLEPARHDIALRVWQSDFPDLMCCDFVDEDRQHLSQPSSIRIFSGTDLAYTQYAELSPIGALHFVQTLQGPSSEPALDFDTYLVPKNGYVLLKHDNHPTEQIIRLHKEQPRQNVVFLEVPLPPQSWEQ